jgi:hypothetical protein
MSYQFRDVRYGPISPYDFGVEQLHKEASAEPSLSNLDSTTSEDQDITSSTTPPIPESLKRKNPDDGFDENNVRGFLIFSSWSHFKK